MRVDTGCFSYDVENEQELEELLKKKDRCGGGLFWIAESENSYPYLGIRVTESVGDIHFFPEEGHPGFRCIGGEDLPKSGNTVLIYYGCDPADGEETPNEFIVPFATLLVVAKEFLQSKKLPESVKWLEL